MTMTAAQVQKLIDSAREKEREQDKLQAKIDAAED